MDEKFLPLRLRSRLLALPRILAQWEPAARLAYNVFFAIYRHPFLSNIVVFIIYAVLLLAVAFVVNLHETLLPPSGPLSFFYNYIVPFIVLLLALLLYSIPILLIAHSDRMRKVLLFEVSRSLDLIGQQMSSSLKDTPHAIPDTAIALDKLIESVEKGGSSSCMLTPNAFYLRADYWRRELRGSLPKSGPFDIVDIAAARASRFRDALTSFSGELHLILPDHRDRKVRTFLQERATILRLPEDTLVRINMDATNWIKGDLRKKRKKEGHKTFLHLTNRSPGFRFMILDDICFMQEFPIASYGVQQPIIMIDRNLRPNAFAAIESGLKSISSLF